MLDLTKLENKMAKWFKEEEIVKILKILKEVEAGSPIRDVIRNHNVSEQSYYRWRQKYGGMETSEVRRLKDLERENSELKKIVADLTLDNRMLKDVNAKYPRGTLKWWAWRKNAECRITLSVNMTSVNGEPVRW